MASAAESGSNGVGVEAGDLSPEDAERFASQFKPSWEFDDAPFAAGAGLTDSLQSLAIGGTNDVVRAAIDADLAAAATASLSRAPATSTVVMDRPVAANEAIGRAPSQQSQQPDQPMSGMGIRPQAQAAMAVAQNVSPRIASRSRPEDTGNVAVIKKSNKGIVFAAIGIVASVGLILGIRAATSSEPEPVHTSTQTTPTTQKEEPRIPPPIPTSEIPTTATPPEPVTATPPNPSPVAATPSTPTAQPAATPPREPPRAVDPRVPPRAPTPQPGHGDHRPPPPVAPPPKGPPKPPGGIVRDNPF